ncbi:MAG: hypothetical protein V5A74_04470 [Desulfohalobiaceae bacterium]
MKKAVILLITLAAAGLLVTQASAWWGGPHMMGYGGPAYTANQAPEAANGDIAQIRAEIASIQADLNKALAQDKVNMDKVRELNQKIGQKQQELRSAAVQARANGQRGYGGHGYHAGGHRPCW